jgi:hypothetical protein
MKNKYVSVRCPSCGSTVQMKARSFRSEVFFCPVCETGEIESPDISLIIDCYKVKSLTKQPIPVTI